VTKKAASSVHKTNLRVAAIVLAAGEARRMGSAKGLLPWRGETLLRHCVRTALASQCDEVYIVLGAHEDALRPEVADLDARVVRHENWQEGMGSSLASAARQLPPHLDGVVVLLCDQPFVSAELIDQLIARGDGRTMVASSYNDTTGAPAYFASCTRNRNRLKPLRSRRVLSILTILRVTNVHLPSKRVVKQAWASSQPLF
jgi:molybdenum cofactor cytidylyltransferase